MRSMAGSSHLAVPAALAVLVPVFSSAQQHEDRRLTFDPSRPVAGSVVEVAYRPIPELGEQTRLSLRARERTRADEGYNTGLGSRTVAVLEPSGDGWYRGRFPWPDDVVYAAFAVEDPDGSVVDARGGEFWELLLQTDTRPRFAALVQRFNDHMGRGQLVVLETAREAARLYPDTIQAWTLLRAAEGWVLGAEGVEARAAEHEQRAARFDSVFRDASDLAADQVGYMYWYARDELRDYWGARLLAEHPGHFFAIQEQVMAKRRELGDDPGALLVAMDSLWEMAGSDEARARVAGVAFDAALEAGVHRAAREWAARRVQVAPGYRAILTVVLARNDGTRETAIPELRSLIEELDDPADTGRPLGATRAEYREEQGRRAASLRTSLGEVLLTEGREREAVAALRRAASVGWAAGRYVSLGEALLATGDTAAAIEAFAAAAVDPATPVATADSLRARVSAPAARWHAAKEEARETMRRRTLSSSRDEDIGDVAVEDPAGRPVPLDELLGEEATVVAIWSRYCGYSARAMPELTALGERLASDGVPVLAVTRDDPEEARAFLADAGLTPAVWYDSDGEAVRALDSWGTPQYFVLDGAGRLRFAYSSLADLPRQVWALRTEQ
jgi:peroxiredoxin/tetratricopeptide (TPR) repeat protein